MQCKLPISVFVLLLMDNMPLFSQVEKVVYQYLKIEDSVSNIQLHLTDDFEVFYWHHENQILIESHAQLDGGNMDLLAILIREGRYKVYLDKKGIHSDLKNVIEKRFSIRNKGNLCQETVKIKIFIPDIFENHSPQGFHRIKETATVAKN